MLPCKCLARYPRSPIIFNIKLNLKSINLVTLYRIEFLYQQAISILVNSVHHLLLRAGHLQLYYNLKTWTSFGNFSPAPYPDSSSFPSKAGNSILRNIFQEPDRANFFWAHFRLRFFPRHSPSVLIRKPHPLSCGSLALQLLKGGDP